MNSEPSKALRVLQRLDLESRGLLVALDREERDALYESLYTAARKAWPVGEPEPDHSMILVETAIEGQGELAWAAALYALLHDWQTGENPVSRYERAVLRFKLGHVLFLLDEQDEDNIRRCLGLTEETLRQAEALWRGEGISVDAFLTLIFELQSWLGHRYERLGLYQEAEHAFSQASISARNTTDHVAYTVRQASVMEKLGKKQYAYELVLMVRDELPEVEDKVVHAMWETVYGSLRLALGGDQSNRGHRFDFGLLEDLASISQMMADQSPSALEDDEKFSRFVEQLRQWSLGLPEDDPILLYERLNKIAIFLIGAGRDAEAREFLQKAEALEESFADEVPKLAHRIVLARRQQHILHDFSGAREAFLGLLPDAERLLDVEEKLTTYGYVLESLGAYEGAPDCDLVLSLAEKGCALFEEVLDLQPGGAARRRIREVYQRFFEGTLLALGLTALRVGDETDKGQELLKRAWAVAMAARNPELRAAISVPGADERQSLRKLEDAFHRALHNGRGWEDSLARVHEHELAIVRASREPSAGVRLGPPPDGVSLVFFLLRDLVRQPALMVLGFQGDRFTAAHGITKADELVLGPLAAWSASLSVPPAEASRDLSPARSALRTPGEIRAPLKIDQLLPASLSTFLSQPASPWFLFPDGALNEVPLEMLPGPGDTRFGQGRSVRLCLRPAVTAACRARVDFSRGWLGLGGAPAALGLPYLSGSLDEVEGLARFLQEKGHPAAVLSGPGATAAGLQAQLDALHPAVLHFAVHGRADLEHPDACALILADDQHSPERELFPFRRIRDLDLSQVGLVVLSACKSLIGRSGRDAGMEGLAWAFLQAGATQVIASRYSVQDAVTARFMTVLYEHLLRHPVAEALGHARDECLSRWTMPAGQAGAWSVWS